mgnify:CR=1 FL=1
MIFAAGFGTRMGSLTRDCPKPLLTVAGRTLLDRTRDLAAAAGLSRVVVNAHYLADRIAAHLDGTGCTVLIESPDILDTGGGLKAAVPYLGDGPAFTANPDIVFLGPNPFDTLAATARPDDMASILLVPLERAIGPDAGDFRLDAGRPRRVGDFVFTGIQIIQPDAVRAESKDVFSLNRVWDRLIAENALGAAIYPGSWCDVGTPEGIDRAEALLKAGHM